MTAKQNECDFYGCFINKLASKAGVDKIDKEKQTQIFKKGAVIFKEGEETKGIYFLLDGCVKIHKEWGKDKELILHFNKSGDIFGYRGMGDETIYPITATVLMESKIAFISLAFFNKLLLEDHTLTLHFLKFHLNELRTAEKRMRDLALMDVKGRIADTLLMLQSRFGVEADGFICVKLKRQDLASYAGTTYETFFRTIVELSKEGAILTEDKNFKIINSSLLESYCRV